MAHIAFFKQPVHLSVFACRCIARSVVDYMDILVKEAVHERKECSEKKESVQKFIDYLKTLINWWCSEIIIDQTSPMYGIMKTALIKAAEDKWKNEAIVWAVLLKSVLFTKVTVDFTCGSTGDNSEEICEELYRDILRQVTPLSVRELKVLSSKLYASQTRLVRDILCFSPYVSLIQVPVLTHYILDGISNASNLEELEVVICMGWHDWEANLNEMSVLNKMAEIFLGSYDLEDLIVKAHKGEKMKVPFPKIKRLYVDINEDTFLLCHAISCYYHDVKFSRIEFFDVEEMNTMVSGNVHGTFGVGAFFPYTLKTCLAPSVLRVDHLILSGIVDKDEDDFEEFNVTGITRLDILEEDIDNTHECIKNFSHYCMNVKMLGIANGNHLSLMKSPLSSQIVCIELFSQVEWHCAFSHFPNFPNLRHLVIHYTYMNSSYVNRIELPQIDQLTIVMCDKEMLPNPKLLTMFMLSFPALQKLHLEVVTKAMWTSAWLNSCGRGSVKSLSLTVAEELDSTCTWLESFPGLENLIINSTVIQRDQIHSNSRLDIRYRGNKILRFNWWDDHDYVDD